MKQVFTFILILTLFHIQAQDYSLIMNNGTAVGSFAYGDTVHVFSDKAPAAGVFTHWSGTGTDYLDIADEWTTTLVVPAQSGVSELELNANYDQLPAGAMQVTEMISLFGEDEGVFMSGIMKEVHYSIPENPKGIVFLFHGSGGAGGNMYSRYEIFSLIKDLYYAGYGSIATDANERTLGDQNGDEIVRWIAGQAIQQTLNNNIDLYNIAALRDSFLVRYNLPEDFPFFSYGVSNGANFSDLAAALVGFEASAHNTGNGSPALYSLHPDVTPVIWLQSINDQNDNADPAVAQANHQALLDRGICSEWYWLEKSPLYEKRFMRSRNGIGAQKSVAIYNRFFDYPNLVDAEGLIQVEEIIASIPNDFYDPLGLTFPQISDAQSQMKVVNADHSGHGNFNKTIIRFFENNCPTTPTETPYERATEVSVFPNPSSGQIFIAVPNTIDRIITVSDLKGRIVLQESTSDQKITLNLLNEPDGLYLISIADEGQTLTRKIVLHKN